MARAGLAAACPAAVPAYLLCWLPNQLQRAALTWRPLLPPCPALPCPAPSFPPRSDNLARLFDAAEERQLLLNLLLHCADISNPVKPAAIAEK